MFRLFLLSSVVAVCQRDLYDSVSWLKCKCRNVNERLLFTTSHHKLDNGKWDTSIFAKDSCHTDSALNLWNMIAAKDECTPVLPKPPRGKRPSESAMIVKGYERHGSSLYKFHHVTQEWENARRTCLSEGAHLAIVNSEEEAKILEIIFARFPTVENSNGNYYALVGFHDQFTEGNFLTIFGEPIDVVGFSEWEPGEPNNDRKNFEGNPGENCGSVTRKGRLNDVPCWNKYAFFCELEDKDYPPISEINYMAGYYTGVESVVKPPPGTVKRKMPSSGYKYIPDVGFYKMHTETQTWENARRICESEDAHLAIINSEKESAVLSVLVSKHEKIYDTRAQDFAFVGFHDQFTEGQYLTIYNETLESTGFMKWQVSEEPNNFDGSPTHAGEDCGSVHKDGKLNDVNCQFKYPFICEQPLLM